jgi:hypothetical protein
MYHSDEAQRTAHCRLFVGILGDASLATIENMLLFRPGFCGSRALGSAPVQMDKNPKITEIWTINSQSSAFHHSSACCWRMKTMKSFVLTRSLH